MNITRHNYEEFFLLYVDNELTADARKAVEGFVEQNPDLEEELVMLQQSVIHPEKAIVFANKDVLLKNATIDGLINETNYEEYFVLYGDNELTNNEKDLVEQFVYKNPQHQAAFELIQQVKLVPDSFITFPGKQDLYRSEEDDKVVPFPWRKMVAAAIIIVLMGGFLWYSLNNNTAPNPAGPNEVLAIIDSAKKDNGDNSSDNQPNNVAVTTDKKLTEQENNDAQKSMAVNNNSTRKEVTVPVNREPVKDLYTAKNNSQKNNPVNSNNPDEIIVQHETTPNVKDRTIEAEKVDPGIIASLTKPANVDIAAINVNDPRSKLNIPDTQIIYVDEQTDDVTYVANTSVNKNPLRGLFRKVTRVFDKNTSTDDEERNKKGIRIANFEIALK